MLNQEFNRHYTAIDPLRQDNILIYDQSFQLIASSDRGITSRSNATLPCQHIIDHLRSVTDVQRTKTSSQLCEYNDQTVFSTVVPIGNLKPEGYINIITNPAPTLANMETELGIPLKIYNKKHQLLHQSSNWPINNKAQNHLVSPHFIFDKENNVSLYLYAASDITAFKTQLNATLCKLL